MNPSKTAVAIVALLVGCAASQVGAPLVVPSVRAGTNPPRWEYLCFNDEWLPSELTRYLNSMGAQGWELVGGTDTGRAPRWCMKRALP
jgi:hypothetical protein